MIDYDKLKLAHELAATYYKQTSLSVLCKHSFSFGCYSHSPCVLYIDKIEWLYQNIDDAVDKLTELTQHDKPKPKYEAGQEVWHLHHDDIQESKIIELDLCPEEMYRKEKLLYRLESGLWLEEQLYPSREALIDAQIEYWNNLLHEHLDPKIKECHPKFEGKNDVILIKGESGYQITLNSDGTITRTKVDECQHEQCAIPEMVYRCIKCGEFYK